MILELKNSELSVKISTLGAELQSVIFKGREYLWQGNPEFWSNRATVLFPVVGRCLNDEIITDYGRFSIGRHGFAKNTEFEIAHISSDECTLSIRSSNETKKRYPYDFEFSVTYRIQGNRILNSFNVKNTGHQELMCSVGGHPGFNCRLSEDGCNAWEIITEYNEPLFSLPVTDEGYIIPERSIPVEHSSGHIKLRRSLFEHDALIFDNIKSKKITLKNMLTGIGAAVEFSDFPSVGIWTLPKAGADFVCIEPWCGMAHNIGESGRFEDKRDLIKIASGNEHTKSFIIEVF